MTFSARRRPEGTRFPRYPVQAGLRGRSRSPAAASRRVSFAAW